MNYEPIINYFTSFGTNPLYLIWSIIIALIIFLILAAILRWALKCDICLNFWGLKIELRGKKNGTNK